MEPNQPVQQTTQLTPIPPQPVVPTTPTITSQPKASKLPIILLALISLLSLSGLVYFYLQTKSLKQQTASQPSPTPITSINPSVKPSQTTDPTTNWKTYTNSSSNYTIKYPASWNIVNQAAGSKTDTPDPEARYIEIAGATTGTIGLEEIQIIPPSEEKSLTITKTVNNITLRCNGNFTDDTKTWCWVKVPDQEKYLNIQVFKGIDPEYNKVLDQILSTFQFMDSQ